jgi:phospholipid transport system transporter-binding protein
MALFTQQGNNLTIHSSMTVDTVAMLLTEVMPELKQAREIDLKQVPDVDSSALSLMFEWLRQARENKVKLSYCNLPDSLVSLAELYGVLEMIPQHKAN